MNQDDLKKLLDEQENRCADWLEGNRKNQEIAPLVNDELQRVKLLKEALNVSSIAGTALPYDVTNQIVRTAEEWKGQLLPLPDYNRSTFGSLASLGTAALSDVRNFVVQTVNMTDVHATQPIPTVHQFFISYRQYEETLNRPQRTLELIKRLTNSAFEDRFQKAQTAYNAYKNGTRDSGDAASPIRNLLHSLNGFLLEVAPKHPKEQKLSWQEYADRLASGGTEGIFHEQLVRQGEEYHKLINALSPSVKDRQGIDLDDIWERVLDHIYIVLSVINV